MKLYSEGKNFKLYNGNMLDMLSEIKPNSIDSIVTDPPYELNFMGKDWDSAGISFQKSTWEKCFEVLKPGGHMLVFGGSRTFHRIACAIEDAGFEIRDTIMWLYGSGFPKSMDISKQIDKKPQANRTIEFKKWLKNKLDNCGKTYKQINDECGFTATSYSKTDFRDYWSTNHPNKEKWYKMKEVIGITETDYDWVCENNVNERGYIEPTGGLAGGSGNTVGCFTGKQLSDNAIDDNAKKWQGWGTCLKPSFEPIVLARKPFNGSLIDNVLNYDVGGINIDECRVPFESTPNPATNPLYRLQAGYKTTAKTVEELGVTDFGTSKNDTSPLGRFPANTILTYDETDYDEVCGGMPKSGEGNGGVPYNYAGREYNNRSNSMFNGDRPQSPSNYNDNGSASRYFYCAKASKRDRDEGVQECGLKSNNHPTVKPQSLIQYLIRLVTPPHGIVLDPFTGSGSTGKATMYENADRGVGYKFIGIELDEHYCDIATARISYAEGNPIMLESSENHDEESQRNTLFDL